MALNDLSARLDRGDEPGAVLNRGPVHKLIARLCRLQESVGDHQGHVYANDCICGESSGWSYGRDAWPEPHEYWRSDETAVEFIEAAVAEKIAGEQAGAEIRAAAEAVWAIHAKRDQHLDGLPHIYHYCAEDRQHWPCATIRALDPRSFDPKGEAF
ncbi:MAG TPA: hypothetical protein VMZ51_08000 [Acidimicrobiales bacterium]|nr:hypothetical protein [Acidimicrobiales bacterium]